MDVDATALTMILSAIRGRRMCWRDVAKAIIAVFVVAVAGNEKVTNA